MHLTLKQCPLTAKTQQALEIMNRFEEGVMILNSATEAVLINQSLQKLYPHLTTPSDLFQQLCLFTQKHQAQRFDLQAWLKSLPAQQEAHKDSVWLKTPTQPTSLPIRIQVDWMTLDDQIHQLVIMSNQTLNLRAKAHSHLMEASGAGQFITNAQGKIIQPNSQFCRLTGLDKASLAELNYIDWLKQQISFELPFGQVMQTLLKQQFWTGEVRLHPPGQQPTTHAILSLSMILDRAENIEHFVGVIQDKSDLQAAKKQIQQLCYFDQLTGLPNQIQLQESLDNILDTPDPDVIYYAMLYINLDGFKLIDATFGGQVGDELLAKVAQKCQQDLPDKALLARLNGGSFGILYPSNSQDAQLAKQEIQRYAENLIDLVGDRYKLQQHSIHTSASIGICSFSPHEKVTYDSEQLTRYANMAMVEAQKLGGNQPYIFEDTLMQKAKRRLELIEALNHSEMDEEFQLYFQAQVDETQKIVAAETLIRWVHPVLGAVTPDKFIPVAEEGRQIIKIGLWILHKAFIQAKAWDTYFEPIRVSINVSPVQFHEQSFIEMVIGLIKFTQVDPSIITLELTEGVLIQNAPQAMQKIQHLISLGFEISIDDFGTGYSSLSYLQKLPINELKIDKCFIQHIPGEAEDETLVKTIIQLAESKRLKIVAEGVETAQQAAFLKQQQCDIIQQGYYYSRPMPAAEFEKKLTLKKTGHHSA